MAPNAVGWPNASYDPERNLGRGKYESKLSTQHSGTSVTVILTSGVLANRTRVTPGKSYRGPDLEFYRNLHLETEGKQKKNNLH